MYAGFLVGLLLNRAVAVALSITHQDFPTRVLTLYDYLGLTDAFDHQIYFVRGEHVLQIRVDQVSFAVNERRVVERFRIIQSLLKLLGMLSHLLKIKIYLFVELRNYVVLFVFE